MLNLQKVLTILSNSSSNSQESLINDAAIIPKYWIYFHFSDGCLPCYYRIGSLYQGAVQKIIKRIITTFQRKDQQLFHLPTAFLFLLVVSFPSHI